ncbi:MAG: type II secretion system protein [Candidatus Dojkabacteria bacterium]|jgi:type II secretory pathway pseudopilin PulG
MDRKSYKAFTLIEMLIVMGILIILMAVGVAAGRFAIDRANEISHKNGATQLYQALQAYYTDNLKFPEAGSNFATMLGTDGALVDYLDMGSFKGGTNASYYYLVATDRQSTVVCVTLGGEDDDADKGIVCVGNGFGVVSTASCGGAASTGGTTLTKERLDSKGKGEVSTEYNAVKGLTGGSCVSIWDSEIKDFD